MPKPIPSNIKCIASETFYLRKNANDGHEFLGCAIYPRCKVTLPRKSDYIDDLSKWEIIYKNKMKNCHLKSVSSIGRKKVINYGIRGDFHNIAHYKEMLNYASQWGINLKDIVPKNGTHITYLDIRQKFVELHSPKKKK